jgi:hypothetical protein
VSVKATFAAESVNVFPISRGASPMLLVLGAVSMSFVCRTPRVGIVMRRIRTPFDTAEVMEKLSKPKGCRDST